MAFKKVSIECTIQHEWLLAISLSILIAHKYTFFMDLESYYS